MHGRQRLLQYERRNEVRFVHYHGYSRCQTVSRMDFDQVRAVCEAAMREYGMPLRIRTDNGAPFAGAGLLGLSKLSLGWMKLGIVHERIQPGRPQHGRHERMHRTLKEDTTKPPALTLRLQQRNSMASGGCSITSARTKASTTRRLAVSISPVP